MLYHNVTINKDLHTRMKNKRLVAAVVVVVVAIIILLVIVFLMRLNGQ